eukprot:1493919-Pyramimonas_sp.AAC.1
MVAQEGRRRHQGAQGPDRITVSSAHRVIHRARQRRIATAIYAPAIETTDQTYYARLHHPRATQFALSHCAHMSIQTRGE